MGFGNRHSDYIAYTTGAALAPERVMLIDNDSIITTTGSNGSNSDSSNSSEVNFKDGWHDVKLRSRVQTLLTTVTTTSGVDLEEP